MPVRAVLLVIAASLLFAPSAWAQDDDAEYPVDPTLPGLYIGSSIGSSWARFDPRGNFGPSLLTSYILGYRASEYISLETEFEWLNGWTDDMRIKGWITSLGFRVHVPIGRIEPYLTYGGAILHVEGRRTTLGRVDASDFAMLGGGGLAYQLNDELSLFAEGVYTRPISGVKGFDHASLRLGLLYKFGEE